MCGIWAFISNKKIKEYGKYYTLFMNIKHRGPDYSSFDLIHKNILLGFHRLAIIDLSAEGNQPFHHSLNNESCVYSVTNGEIYQHCKLKEDYKIKTKSNSDCEVIVPLYEKLGLDKLFNILGSEFATIIIDIRSKSNIRVIVGRDPVGVRPLFFSYNEEGLMLSSELKGLDIKNKNTVFPPGHYLVYEPFTGMFTFCSYHSYNLNLMVIPAKIYNLDCIKNNIRQLFISSVFSRLKTDREFGCLLSGGLDSSLVAGVCKFLLPDKKFDVFTIAFSSGSTDLPYASFVSKYLNLNHHIIEIDEKEALSQIENTIYTIESYDITTVRASVMQYLVAKYIRKNTDIKVILVGENSDELFGGYLYSHLAPSDYELKKDTINLVKNVHMFDGLRTDRTMASCGIEVRLPFADSDFVDYIFSLPEELIKPNDGIEKFLLRESFECMDLIPKEILYRRKEAFSDAVSEKSNSWYKIIQTHVDTLISDEEFETHRNDFDHLSPTTKEAYYYRKIFEKYFGSESNKVIPYMWMPKWTTTSDPSARTLDIY